MRRATGNDKARTGAGGISHSTGALARAEGLAMLPPTRVGHSMRNLPHLGTRHDDDHEVLPGHADFLGGSLDQGGTVATDPHDPLVVHGHHLAKMRRVLLH